MQWKSRWIVHCIEIAPDRRSHSELPLGIDHWTKHAIARPCSRSGPFGSQTWLIGDPFTLVRRMKFDESRAA
jgi:hypothetical protein